MFDLESVHLILIQSFISRWLVNSDIYNYLDQVKAMLVNEGYPVSLVNACLVNLLSDQHICY